MADVRINLHGAAMRDILRSEGVRRDLERRAQRIAAAAGPGHVVRSEIGRNRADAEVIAQSFEARKRQARDNNLVRALNAGRG